ncbi:8750_t:CDS:2 [Cetraspora pellucida]|uniref:8750_t:CDS:1 n=1 Tax=Cetraspora pellucida TaxID=1433469 RepID=A0A9N8VD50_9GLOM|nr:8750_t:CDS:2 [Cetraspora pellucida]
MVNKAIKNIVDQNRVSTLFRDTFTGPTCLYHWLNNRRPPRFLRRNLSYLQQKHNKKLSTRKSKNIQEKKGITLDELFEGREKEEQFLSTSRIKRALQLTFEGLVVINNIVIFLVLANQGSEVEPHLQLECEITLYKIKRDHSRKRRLSNGKWESCEYRQIFRTLIQMLHGEGGCYVKDLKSLQPYVTSFDDAGEPVQDLVLNFRVYAINNQTWPPNTTLSSSQIQISNEHGKLNIAYNLGDCTRRTLCNQLEVIENGKFIKDGQYDVNLRLLREQDSIIPSDWKIRFTLYWDCKVHLPLRPIETSPLAISNIQHDELPVTYIYRVADCQLTQVVKGFRCPWCSHLRFKDSGSMMIHLRCNHIHLKFGTKIGRQLPSDRVIIVSSNEDFSEFDYFIIDKKDGSWTVRPFIYPIKRHQSTSQLPLALLPTNNFYHSHSFMPFKEGDVDSEDEICTHWLEQLNDETLDELSDASDKEKQMMKIWNRYIEPQRGLADRNLPDVCLQFAKTRARQIAELELRNEFAFHLLNILEFKLIDSACVTKCLGFVDKVISKMC